MSFFFSFKSHSIEILYFYFDPFAPNKNVMIFLFWRKSVQIQKKKKQQHTHRTIEWNNSILHLPNH